MNKLIILLLSLIVAFGCSESSEKHDTSDKKHDEHKGLKTFYTCSMHPQIKQNAPGKCPICHMTLTKVEIDEFDSKSDEQAASAQKEMWQCKDYPDVTSENEEVCPIDGSQMIKMKNESKAQEVIARVKLRKSQLGHFYPDYFPVTTMKMQKKIRLLGTVLQSEDRESNIPARIGGRVEKVYIKSTGSLIQEGDPTLDLYSPKLITAGEEYLIARKSYQESNAKEFKEMLEQSKQRLGLWGIKSFQYESWFKNGKVPKSITIYSPSTGIVRKRNAIVGKYFEEGQNFFELSDLSDIWVEMDVYEYDAGLVKIGQKIKMEFSSLPGEILEGEIDFIDPILNAKSRTLKVRATISNRSGKLKPGMIADAMLEVELDGMPLVVPRTAIIDTGKRKVVWVKISPSQFQAKIIRTGQESEGYVEVKHGLMEGEEVVIEGNFLLDAQAQLFGGYEDMTTSSSSHSH